MQFLRTMACWTKSLDQSRGKCRTTQRLRSQTHSSRNAVISTPARRPCWTDASPSWPGSKPSSDRIACESEIPLDSRRDFAILASDAGWRSGLSHRPHNPENVSSNLTPATSFKIQRPRLRMGPFSLAWPASPRTTCPAPMSSSGTPSVPWLRVLAVLCWRGRSIRNCAACSPSSRKCHSGRRGSRLASPGGFTLLDAPHRAKAQHTGQDNGQLRPVQHRQESDRKWLGPCEMRDGLD